jgi:hypothetical protein
VCNSRVAQRPIEDESKRKTLILPGRAKVTGLGDLEFVDVRKYQENRIIIL